MKRNWFKDNLWPSWFWNSYYGKLNQAYENGYRDGMGQKGHNDLVVLVRKQTKEGIIKQIETLRCPENGVEHDCLDELGGYTVNDLIALIRGEK